MQIGEEIRTRPMNSIELCRLTSHVCGSSMVGGNHPSHGVLQGCRKKLQIVQPCIVGRSARLPQPLLVQRAIRQQFLVGKLLHQVHAMLQQRFHVLPVIGRNKQKLARPVAPHCEQLGSRPGKLAERRDNSIPTAGSFRSHSPRRPRRCV